MNLLDLAKGPSSSFGEKKLVLEFVCGLVPRKYVISNLTSKVSLSFSCYIFV